MAGKISRGERFATCAFDLPRHLKRLARRREVHFIAKNSNKTNYKLLQTT